MSEGSLIAIIIVVFSIIGAIITYISIKKMYSQTQTETAEIVLARSHEYENKSLKHIKRLTMYYVVSAVLISLFFILIY